MGCVGSPVESLALRAISSAGERSAHTGEVTGSIPVSPTSSERPRSAGKRGPGALVISAQWAEPPEAPRCGGCGRRGRSLLLGLIPLWSTSTRVPPVRGMRGPGALVISAQGAEPPEAPRRGGCGGRSAWGFGSACGLASTRNSRRGGGRSWSSPPPRVCPLPVGGGDVCLRAHHVPR
ncbi:MAG: hypothetical protein QOH97_4256 [Actinoplanes sp.]|nr:hypothetical protein [Actinoplanes sp.]